MRASALLALAVAVTAATACGRSPAAAPAGGAATDVVAALVPSTRAQSTDTPAGAGRSLPDVAARIPPGAQVVRFSGGTPHLLSGGLLAAGAPCVRPDGRAVLFVAKAKEGDAYAVYECAADGSDCKVLVRHATDCQAAAYLPDGRIVYAAAIDAPSPVAGARSAQALFVAKGDGAAGARITFGAGFDADPVVLTDGRILYSSWRDAEGGGRLGLYTVFPDGTGFAPFHLDAGGDAVRPVQQPDLDVRYTLVAGGAARERVASWDAPMSAASDAAPLALPIAAQTPATGAATVVDAFAALVARPRAQGQLSVVKDDRTWGTLYCVDARRGSPGAVTLRVRTAGDATVASVVADVPLAADGSFHVRVPPDTPILLETLDAAGRTVVAEHGPIWVRRNEVRGCVGCHDDVETAPPNVRPAAVSSAPVDLSAVGSHVR